MNRLVAAAAAGALIIGSTLIAAGPAVAADTGTVTVVHQIPGLPVDVYVDGARALDDFQPATVAGPVQVPADAHKIAITKADAADAADASASLLTADADLPAGANVSLVAHLKADGTHAVTTSVNDVSTIQAGRARLVVRHTAAGPAVDVRAGGTPALIAFVVTGLHSTPSGVPAGSGPAQTPYSVIILVFLGTAGAGLALVGGRRLLTSGRAS